MSSDATGDTIRVADCATTAIFGGRTMEQAFTGEQGRTLLALARTVSYTHLRAHETPEHLVCRLLLEKKKTAWLSFDNLASFHSNTRLSLIKLSKLTRPI